MDKWNLTGRFTVKDGATEDQFSLHYEAGPGPMVILQLWPGITKPEAEELARALHRDTSGVVVDFSYSPAAKLGFGPSKE
jgi:hypothetical protein